MDETLDKQAIWARRREFVRLALSGAAAVTVSAACPAPCLSVRPRELRPGGLFVAQVCVQRSPCELRHGDLIQAVDGIHVSTPEALAAALLDGQPHMIEVLIQADASPRVIDVTIEGEVLPFVVIDAALLEGAPSWARRRLFGHVLPEFNLVPVGGGEALSAELMAGRRWLIALIDWMSSHDRRDAAVVLQVLQKAQSDLDGVGVSLAYGRVRYPTAGNADDEPILTEFMTLNQVSAGEGGPLPLPPAYEQADSTRARGDDLDRLGGPPDILVLDERGVVRWHSGGATPDPSGMIEVDMAHTTVEAVLFARDQL